VTETSEGNGRSINTYSDTVHAETEN